MSDLDAQEAKAVTLKSNPLLFLQLCEAVFEDQVDSSTPT